MRFTKTKPVLPMIFNGSNGVNQLTVLLLGMERSGTSMTAAVLDALGVEMDGSDDGHFERESFKNKGIDSMQTEINKLNKFDRWGVQVNINRLEIQHLIDNARNPFLISVFRDAIAITQRILTISGREKFQVKELHNTMELTKEILNISCSVSIPVLCLSNERLKYESNNSINQITGFLGLKVNKKQHSKALRRIGNGYLIQ